MSNKYFNPIYVGMTETEKQKNIRMNYYQTKGKLKASIKARCKRFGFDKELFKDCKSVDELNDKVKNELAKQGYSSLDISRLFIVRKSTYTQRKST